MGSLWVHGGVNAAVGSEEMVIKLALQEQRTWVDGVLLLHVICIDRYPGGQRHWKAY